QRPAPLESRPPTCRPQSVAPHAPGPPRPQHLGAHQQISAGVGSFWLSSVMSKLRGTRVARTGVIVWMHGPGLHADQGRRGHTAPCAHTPTRAFSSAELDESQGMVRGTEAAHAPGPHAWE